VYLVYIELFRVDAICLWCTGVHVCTVLMFGAVLWRTSVIDSAVIDTAVPDVDDGSSFSG